MPHIIAIAGQKGGPGKTTTTINLGDAFARRGLEVLMIDADAAQGSLRAWGETAADDAPPVASIDKTSLIKLRNAGHLKALDVLLIDCPGHLDGSTRAALTVADLVVVPLRPSQMDLARVDNTWGAIDDARAINPGLRELFVLNQANSGSPKRENMARDKLTTRTVAETVLHYYLDHQDAAGSGTGICSYDPSSKAAAEIEALATEVLAQLEGGDDGEA